MKHGFTTLVSLFLLVLNLQAQSGFEKVYGGDLPDAFRAVIATSDGGILAGGSTKSFGGGSLYNSDAYLVKMNANGDTLWTRSFGSIYDDQVVSVVENAVGYVVIAWNVPDTPVVSSDFFAEQLDPNGNTLWEKFYGSPSYEFCNDAIIDSHGRIIMGGASYGYSYGLSNGLYDFYVIKLDASGNKIGEGHFGGSGNEWTNAIIQTSDGGYVMAGYTNTGTLGYDIYLVKTDSNFNFQWAHNYGDSLDDYAYDIAEDINGNLWILGSWESSDSSHLVVIKTDANGGNAVMKFPGLTVGDFCYHIQELNSGGILIGGYTGTPGKGNEMLLEKLDANGDTLWTKHFGGTQNEIAFAVATDAANNILLAGETEGFGVNQFDAYLVKMDSDGNTPCPSTLSFTSSADSVCEDENVFFTNTTVSSQQFSWSENTNNFSNNIDAAYYFSSGGNYDVALAACNLTFSQNITVNTKPPAHFTYTLFGTVVSFTLDPGINVQAISWNFGDGSQLNTNVNPAHTYSNPGLYWVIVSVTNENGCDSTYIEQISVPTGIEEVASDNVINLFPNPAHEFNVIEISSGHSFPLNASILSIEGKVIREFAVKNNHEKILLNGLFPGVYFVKIRDQDGTSASKKFEVY